MITPNFRWGNKSTEKLRVRFCKSLVIVSLSMTILTMCFACSLFLIDIFILFSDIKFSRSHKLPLPFVSMGGFRGSHHQVSARQTEMKIAPGWRASVCCTKGSLSFQWKYSWSLVLLKVLGPSKQLHGCYCKNKESLQPQAYCICLGETNTCPSGAHSQDPSPVLPRADVDSP